jgi:hypothetical protein
MSTVGRSVRGLALVVAATVAASALVGVAPASANDGDCGPGDLCLWENPGPSGGRWDDAGYVYNYASGNRWWGTETSINDTASAARCNYSFWTCVMWEHSYMRGTWVQLFAGGQIPNLHDYEFGDKASSNDY